MVVPVGFSIFSLATRICICLFLCLGTVDKSPAAEPGGITEEPTRTPGLFFSDQTATTGINVTYTAHGGVAEYGGGGAAGDFNRDGWQDIFVPSDGNRPHVLFINNGNGSFTSHAGDWGLTETFVALGLAVGDFNADGWIDVFIAGGKRHLLYRNKLGQRFVDETYLAGVSYPKTANSQSVGATFSDYDLDGDLDLFVAGIYRSFLYQNRGNGRFFDATDRSGLALRLLDTAGLAPRFVDMDGDRYPELLLAADLQSSGYFVNQGDGTFVDHTLESGTGLDENGMGQSVADFNGDGLLDWYVSSIYAPDSFWTGNKLYINLDNHRYRESATESGVDDGGFGWATVAADFDHDGDIDLAETNGVGDWFSTSFTSDPSCLWLNRGDGSFDERGTDLGFVHYGIGRGLVNFDYDNDGDQDVVIFGSGPAMVLRNDLDGKGTRWLRIFLDTTDVSELAPDGLGTKVTVSTAGKTQVRFVDGGDNFVSVSELSAHFGLGTAEIVDRLEVEWSNGRVTTLENVATNQILTVSAPPTEFRRGDSDSDGNFDLDDILTPFLALFINGHAIPCEDAADIDDSGQLDIGDAVLTLHFLFLGNFEPAPPFPNCGADPSDDSIRCRLGLDCESTS